MPQKKEVSEPTGWTLEKTNETTAVLHLSGDWRTKEHASRRFDLPDGIRNVRAECEALGEWGTFLPAFLNKVHNACRKHDAELDVTALPEGVRELLRLAWAEPPITLPAEPKFSLQAWLQEAISGAHTSCISWMAFIGDIALAIHRLFRGTSRMKWHDVWLEVIKAGPDAFGIVSLIGFLMGLILAFIGSIPLKWFSAETYVASLIGIGMLRMMGAVMTGVVMAGRTGAAYAAELGTMQVNEEIDALLSMDISPIDFLVLPRIIALTLMMPLLCLYGDIAGVLGGMAVGSGYLGVSGTTYWNLLTETTSLNNLYVGLFTSVVFGILIGICGCLRGLQCGRSSEAVGRATTSAMVTSIVCLVISTSIITVLTVFLKI
ncbi:MAG: ABC transporter permease [Victivallales bacterium]|nr:ABC transporter permease [Victivallales bacterium]